MRSLTEMITELENKLSFLETKNEKISKASIGWHIEHSLLALIKMISAVEHSNPSEFKLTFNWKRSYVLTLGKMPRGVARVPESVKPGASISEASIRSLLEKSKQKIESFEKLERGKYFTHPVFGDVRVTKARKVIAIHTNHHILIINDILKA